MSLAELDHWDPGSIHAVFAAVQTHADSTREIANSLKQVVNAVPWEGAAHDAALAANQDIHDDMHLHADQLEAVAKAARTAETEVRSIKADWQYLQQEAAACGMTIDAQNGTVTYTRSSDPEIARVQDENYKVICAEIGKLLARADRADADLAAAINGATGKESAEEINRTLDHPLGDTQHQAERDVNDALAGDKDAAGRVNGVLGSITPEQQAGKVPLTAEQAAVVSQLQGQENGMSIGDLATAERRLDDQRSLIGNSWQAMSNPNIRFPKAGGKSGETTAGGTGQLPRSVQNALRMDGINPSDPDSLALADRNAGDISTITGIVKDGDPALQHGTGIDKGLLDWSARSLHSPLRDPLYGGAIGEKNYHGDYLDYMSARSTGIADTFNAAGRDHLAVHDLLTATGGSATGQQFLSDLHHFDFQTWDQSRSTHTLLDWIGQDAGSPDVATATNAGQAAHALALNLDANHDGLLEDGGIFPRNIGAWDPELVRADATALAPFQRAMIGDMTGTHGFDFIGHPEKGDFSAARNVFAVLDTDHEAAKNFTAAAEQNILRYQDDFAAAAARDPNFGDLSPHYDDMRHAANMLGVLNGGADAEAVQQGLNDADRAKFVFDLKKSALDMVMSKTGVDKLPGFGLAKETIETGILGEPAKAATPGHAAPVYNVQQGLDMATFTTVSALHPQPGDFDPKFIPGGQLLPPDQISQGDYQHYSEQMQLFLGKHPEYSAVASAINRFENQYNHGAGINIKTTDTGGG